MQTNVGCKYFQSDSTLKDAPTDYDPELASVSAATSPVLRRERSEASRHVRDQLEHWCLVLLFHARVVPVLLFGAARSTSRHA